VLKYFVAKRVLLITVSQTVVLFGNCKLIFCIAIDFISDNGRVSSFGEPSWSLCCCSFLALQWQMRWHLQLLVERHQWEHLQLENLQWLLGEKDCQQSLPLFCPQRDSSSHNGTTNFVSNYDVVFTNANSLYKGSTHPFTSNQVTTNAVPPTKSLLTPLPATKSPLTPLLPTTYQFSTDCCATN
jgi:hypothetical protein